MSAQYNLKMAQVVIGLLSLIGAFLAQPVMERVQASRTYRVVAGDRDLQQAFSQARSSLDAFLSQWQNPSPEQSGFAVKVAITEGNNSEFFWITPFQETSDGYTGAINNHPEVVTSIRFGDRILFKRAQIVDWLYFDNRKMVGNYTACAILKREPAQLREFQEEFGLDCDTK